MANKGFTDLLFSLRIHTAGCLAIISALILSACASPPPVDGFSPGFIRHLRTNSPADIRDCIEEKARLRWKNQYQIYGEANQIRMSRGQTDVVNYAVGTLIPSCRPGRPQLPPFRESNRSAPSNS